MASLSEEVGVLPTAEIRWFLEDREPSEVLTWFRNLDAPLWQEPPRVDHYLLVREADSLGVKYREGRIEVKRRDGPPRRVTFGDKLTGALERWTKWGFGLAMGPQASDTFEALDAWYAVRKVRLMHNYAVRRDYTIVALPETLSPEWGCSVELTQATARDQTWWTLGFEATGDVSALTEILVAAARHILANAGMLHLRFNQSFGYPRWLRLLAAPA